MVEDAADHERVLPRDGPLRPPLRRRAFYTDTWDTGFDHEATLAAIHVPAAFIHTNWSYDSDGILLGATDDKDAARARSLIKGVQFCQVDSGHGFHWEKPDAFVKIVDDLADRVKR
jgi:pimeloyl-ACP methyl ester carboxylesterase